MDEAYELYKRIWLAMLDPHPEKEGGGSKINCAEKYQNPMGEIGRARGIELQTDTV